MIKSTRCIIAAIVAVSFLTISTVEAASRSSANILKYIPADTPYVFAATEPMPKELSDKFEPTIDEILKSYQRIARHAMAERQVKMSSEEGGEEKTERFRIVAEEVLGLMSIDGIRSAGIERDSAFALYGNGLLPVLRFELSDSESFDAAIARIEEKAGESLESGVAGRKEYKYVDLDKVRLIIATLGDQAVITVVPAKFDESQVAVALGIKKPRKNLYRSRKLRVIAKEYGFANYMTGFIDNERIAQTFLGEETGLDKNLFAALEYDAPELTDVCKAEFMQLAGIAPRLVFGYSELNTDFLESAMIIELREDIAQGLATLPALVPGLGVDPGGLFSIGFSFNPLAAREFYEARLDAMEADPFECEKLEDLQNGVAKGREMLNQPVPPVVYSFRGIVANIADITGMDMAGDKMPESVDASVLFAIENAQSLVMMGAMMDPQIAALNLVPDGKPVKLEMAQLASVAEQAFAALSENALSVSVGEGAAAQASGMLYAEGSDPAPLISMSMDSARYYQMMADAMMEANPETEGKEMPMAVRMALRDVIVLSGALYERMSVNVRLTDRGVEIKGRMTLSD